MVNLSDRRSYALHRAVADKIRRDPALLRVALTKLDLYEAKAGQHPPYRRWRQIIQCGPNDVIRALLETSEESQILRSASPFTGILSAEERQAIIDSVHSH